MAGRPSKKPGQRLEVSITVLVTAEQAKLIREAAQQQSANTSSWARAVLLEAARSSSKVDLLLRGNAQAVD
jgi:uncharacterized protein (DUF1778 family)